MSRPPLINSGREQKTALKRRKEDAQGKDESELEVVKTKERVQS